MAETREQQKALQTAANVLEYKHRSRAALVRRLVEKGIAEPDALLAAQRLTELGLLDDLSYGRTLVEGYCARGYGAAYIRRALREKLLEPEDIDALLADFEPRQDKMTRYIESRMAGKVPEPKLVKKVSDGLFRRGFSWDEIRAALRAYTDGLEEEPLD